MAASPLGDYQPGTSVLHRLPVGAKLLGLLVLSVVAVIAMAGVMVEDAGQNWSAVYLNAELGAPLATAGLGLVALMAAQFVGRMLGDPMTDRCMRVVGVPSSATCVAIGRSGRRRG